jgi:hypothetical protein
MAARRAALEASLLVQEETPNLAGISTKRPDDLVGRDQVAREYRATIYARKAARCTELEASLLVQKGTPAIPGVSTKVAREDRATSAARRTKRPDDLVG